MNDKYDTIEDGGEFEVNAEFGEDLRSIYGTGRSVPAEVDRAIMGAARKQLGRKGRRFKIAGWAVSAAAAAAVVVFAFVHNYNGAPDLSLESQKLAKVQDAERVAGDYDLNGRVDILDAFLLAKSIDSDEEADIRWDLNGDGKVNEDDVDAVASSAVRLGKGV